MAKKGHDRESPGPASPKRLRRKLEKLEAQLAGAHDKRDRAQARVDALTIMADEVRAALAASVPAPAAATGRDPREPAGEASGTDGGTETAPASTAAPRASASRTAPSAGTTRGARTT